MAFTGKWGGPDDQLGNVVPGYGSFPSQTTASALTLTNVASATKTSRRNVVAASQLVSLSQSVTLQSTANKPVTHTLNLTQVAFSPRQIEQTITHALTLTDSSERGAVYKIAYDTLAITNAAQIIRLPSRSASSALFLTDRARLQDRRVSAANVLSITDRAFCVGPRYVNAVDAPQGTVLVFDPVTVTLVSYPVGLLSDTASAKVSHNNIPASSIISLAQQAIGVVVKASGTAKSASNALSLTDNALLSIVVDANNALSLTHAASATAGVPLSNLLDLSDAVTLKTSHAATSLLTAIGLTDAVRFVLEHTGIQFKYGPFVGSTTNPNAPSPPPSTLPAASELTGFRLLFPSSGSPTDEIVLRAPNLGDIDRLAFDRINRETRGGTLVVFADPIWPKIETLVLQFSVLKKEEAYGLLDFMESHLGRKLRLIDWEHRAWTGYIINPQDPIVEDRENSFTASFEFEGTRE